jgi:hypothetical protein
LSGQRRPDFGKRQIGRGRHQAEDRLGVRLDPLGAAVAALRFRLGMALRALPLAPADGT